MITQIELKEQFMYDPNVGLFMRYKDGWVFDKPDERGYIRIKIDGVRYRAHRLVFLWMTGEMPKNVDHINGIKTDNTWDNLRECTQSENCRNRKVNEHFTTSDIKNVTWNNTTKNWQVQIVEDGKTYYYGQYYYKHIAELVAIGARVKHHGEFARI